MNDEQLALSSPLWVRHESKEQRSWRDKRWTKKEERIKSSVGANQSY